MADAKRFSRKKLKDNIDAGNKNGGGMLSAEVAKQIVDSVLNITDDNLQPPEATVKGQPFTIIPKDDDKASVMNLGKQWQINLKANKSYGFNLCYSGESSLFVEAGSNRVGVNNPLSPAAQLHIATSKNDKIDKFRIDTDANAAFLVDQNANVGIATGSEALKSTLTVRGDLSIGKAAADNVAIDTFSNDPELGKTTVSDNKLPTQKAVKTYVDKRSETLVANIDTVKTDVKNSQNDIATLKPNVESNKGDIAKLKADVKSNQEEITKQTSVLKNYIDKEKFGDTTKVNALEVQGMATFKNRVQLGGVCPSKNSTNVVSVASADSKKGVMLFESELKFVDTGIAHFSIIPNVNNVKQLGFYNTGADVTPGIVTTPLMLLDINGNLDIKGQKISAGNNLELGPCTGFGAIKPLTEQQGVSVAKSSGLTFIRKNIQFSINTMNGSNALAIYSTTEPKVYKDGKTLLTIDQFGSVNIEGNLTVGGSLHVKSKGESNIAGPLRIQGMTHLDGSWDNSDIRLKTEIKPIDNALEKLAVLNPVSFKWNERYTEITNTTEEQITAKQLGVIAQDVEQVFPELVNEQNGYKIVNYQGLIPVLLSAIKEQQTAIDELKQTIADIQQQLNKNNKQ